MKERNGKCEELWNSAQFLDYCKMLWTKCQKLCLQQILSKEGREEYTALSGSLEDLLIAGGYIRFKFVEKCLSLCVFKFISELSAASNLAWKLQICDGRKSLSFFNLCWPKTEICLSHFDKLIDDKDPFCESPHHQ